MRDHLTLLASDYLLACTVFHKLDNYLINRVVLQEKKIFYPITLRLFAMMNEGLFS